MSAESAQNITIPELVQGQWTTVIICTFTADLNFFETRMLGQIAQIPLRIVLADATKLADTFDEAARTGQRHRFVNRSYVAAPIRHPRSAHAKMLMFLGPSEGLLIVGSGNLSYEGYASPGELWHVFRYNEQRPDHLDEFAAARAYIDFLAARQLIDPPVRELVRTAWGRSTWLPPSPTRPKALAASTTRPILERLRDVANGPVQELTAYAPFHDADCAALRELIRIFAPKRVRLLLSSDTSADPAAIARVLAETANSRVDRVQIESEHTAYIHAKWIHLIHPRSETVLTGSANLSRSALLRDAQWGNLEIGVISTGKRGDFNHLYKHLLVTPLHDISMLEIEYRDAPDDEDKAVTHPVVLWSQIDGTRLTLVFDQVLPNETTIEILTYTGVPATIQSIEIEREHVRLSLSAEAAEQVCEGGRIRIRLDADDAKSSSTWPYNLANLRGRLDKADQRDHLPRLGELPELENDLYALLRELDEALIIDRTSAWRIARPAEHTPNAAEPEEGPAVNLEDLDWQRVRRDHRHMGYFARGTAAVSPTAIQIILAAIAGRLGEIGVVQPGTDDEGDDDLAREGDASSSGAEDAEDELEDELTRRRLPISTRTRMAFDRFVRRYAAALDDAAFLDELGPIPAITNAVVFNHLLLRLLERRAVTTRVAVNAQIKTWRFLWGDLSHPAVTAGLDQETAEVAWQRIDDADARTTTIAGIAAAVDLSTAEWPPALTQTARHLLSDSDFDLDTDRLIRAGNSRAGARHLVEMLANAATPIEDAEILEYALIPFGLSRSSAKWRTEQVHRPGKGTHRSITFVITSPVADLSPDLAWEILETVAVAECLSGRDSPYHRVRFEGNGRAMAFWDEDAGSGVVMVGDADRDMGSFDPNWPDWWLRIGDLYEDLSAKNAASA